MPGSQRRRPSPKQPGFKEALLHGASAFVFGMALIMLVVQHQQLGDGAGLLARFKIGKLRLPSSPRPIAVSPAAGKVASVLTTTVGSSSRPPPPAAGGQALTLEGWLQQCQSEHATIIEVRKWMGRTGNRLWQLHTALRIAQSAGRKTVRLPGDLQRWVFKFPTNLAVVPPAGGGKLPCEFVSDRDTYDCDTIFFNRCKMSVEERRQLYVKNIMPYLTHDAQHSCPSPGDDTITVHLRSGDAALSYGGTFLKGVHDQPPCLYYHRVIEEGRDGQPFEKVQLVFSEKELPMNLCVRDIIARHKDKEVIPTSDAMRYDSCLLLKAKNLAVTMSSMSTGFKLMNKRLKRLFFVNVLPEDKGLHFENYDFNTTEACRTYPKAIGYKVLPQSPKMATAEDYFLRFPPASLVQTRCEDILAGRHAEQALPAAATKAEAGRNDASKGQQLAAADQNVAARRDDKARQGDG